MFPLSEQSTQICLRGAKGRDEVNVEGWSLFRKEIRFLQE